MDAKSEMDSLREQLLYHNQKYYNEDAPEISDYAYDLLQRKLRALEAQYPEFDCGIPALLELHSGRYG